MKGKITPSMLYRRFIERSWIDYCLPTNQLACLGINCEPDDGVVIRCVRYKKIPRKGRKCVTYNPATGKDWIDFCKGNVLAPLGIGCDIEPDYGVLVGAPKYGKTYRKGIIYDYMIYQPTIIRPKYEVNWTPFLEKLFTIPPQRSHPYDLKIFKSNKTWFDIVEPNYIFTARGA